MKRLEEIPENPVTHEELRIELNLIIRALNQLSLETGQLALEVNNVEEMVVFKAIKEREILNFSNIRR